MRLLILLGIFATSTAFAQEFRGTQFGESCAGVPARESGLGSRPVDWQNPSPQKLTFEGSALGRRAYIIYLCPKDLLALGDLHFPKEHYKAAAADFRAALVHFKSLYGEPFVVSPDPQPGTEQLVPDGEPVEGRSYNAMWRVGSLNVTVAMILDGARGSANWQAFVVMSQRRGEARSNTSLERTRER
jgi:hypothetical protein